MTIPHFSDQQNLVFVPALIALLVATVLICLPIVFAPALRRGRRSVRRGPVVLAGVLAAVGLVVTGVLAGGGVRVLESERAQVQADVQQRYGLDLTTGEAAELINGGKPERVLPVQAEALKLATPMKKHTLGLVATAPGADTYDLTFAGKPWPGGAAA